MSRRSVLTRSDIVDLLGRMSAEAHRRGIRIALFMVGGAAMGLAYNVERSTTDVDVDAVFEPKRLVYDIAARVAACVQYLVEAIADAAREPGAESGAPEA